MSSDAKVWHDGEGWLSWKGIHDGPCKMILPHDQGDNLTDVISDIEECMGKQLRWFIKIYPDGTAGLVGYES